jgi:hypothetical protein
MSTIDFVVRTIEDPTPEVRRSAVHRFTEG